MLRRGGNSFILLYLNVDQGKAVCAGIQFFHSSVPRLSSRERHFQIDYGAGIEPLDVA